jgi:hypothetical protein
MKIRISLPVVTLRKKDRVLKANKQNGVLCVLCGFAVKPNFHALKGFK